jgi:hypothetical protein
MVPPAGIGCHCQPGLHYSAAFLATPARSSRIDTALLQRQLRGIDTRFLTRLHECHALRPIGHERLHP